ncbi:hypothetical protein F4775DRAFT_542316 [Biscogniauxia sp. FL1348]|nr:hypothetical protein F4775DRAFT_542316 [Biscogniauxia sp. FL1348]
MSIFQNIPHPYVAPMSVPIAAAVFPLPQQAPKVVPPQPIKVVVDPDGDLTLRVGQNKPKARYGSMAEEAITFVVCSRTVARASPVWKKLLYGGFAESKRPSTSSSSEWLVELPEDNPKAMSTMLHIIHSRFENVPRITDSFVLDDLYQLTVLTDKYDLTAVLRPWATSWMRSLHQTRNSWSKSLFPTSADLRRHLWIAWELGDLDHLRKTAKEMILYLPGNILQGNPADLTFGTASHILEIPDLEDMMRKERIRCIGSLLKPFRDIMDRLLQQPKTAGYKAVCQYHMNYYGTTEDCDGALLGVVVRSLSWAGLWPIPEAVQFPGSMRDLETKLKSLEMKSCFPNHPCQALPDRNAKIDKEISAFEVQLKESQLRHIENQAKKSGLRS